MMFVYYGHVHVYSHGVGTENHLGTRFLKVFAIYSHGGHLGHVTWTIYINFCSPFLSLALIGQAVSVEKIFEIVNDGRRTDAGAWVYYKLTCEHSAQVS